MKKKILLFLGLIIYLNSFASSYTGKVSTVRFSSGTSAARVSVYVGQSTSCPSPNWFTYENADTGLGKIWTSILAMAYTTNKEIVIHGSSNCDPYGYETISTIDIK